MKCPHCAETGAHPVIETRKHDGQVFRRRGCTECGGRFVSCETSSSVLRMPSETNRSARCPPPPRVTDAVAGDLGRWASIRMTQEN